MNVMSATFSMMFAIMNTLLIALTFENKNQRYGICGFILTLNMAVLIQSNFVFSSMSYTAWITLGISIVYFLILTPFFGYVIMTIINE